jgi:hypothetical protein
MMKKIILPIVLAIFAIGQYSFAFDTRYILFKTQIGDEVLVGYLEGICGMIKMDYRWKDSLIDLEDANGFRRKIIINKIIEIEILSNKDSKPNVKIHLSEKTVSGSFYCGTVNIVTESEKLDLNDIKKGSIKLFKVK